MKVLILIFLIFSLSSQCLANHDHNDSMGNSLTECLEENGIKQEELEELEEHHYPKLECVMACVFEKEGVMKDGQIDSSLLKKDLATDFPELTEHKISEIVDMCMVSAKETTQTCKKAYLILICLKVELDKLDIEFK